MARMLVVPWAESPPEEACSKLSNLEVRGLEKVPHIQAYLPWRYSVWFLWRRRSLHTLESALQSDSTMWGEPTEGLLHTYSGVSDGNSGDKTLLLWPLLAAGAGQPLGGPNHGSAWVAAPVDLPPHPGPRWPNPTN